MEYGINITFVANPLGMKKAAEVVAKAGFTQLDYTPPLTRDDWKNHMKEAVKIFADHGLQVHQTHAPFNRYGDYGKTHKTCLERCAEATAFMGAKYMVAHGDEFDFENLTFSPEAALQYNHELFLPYVEQGKQNGYKVAFETVFEDWDRRRYTSDAEELLAIIDSYKSDNVVCCWDFGHANITFKEKTPQMIKKFGKRIECTHVHDNTGVDAHQMPRTGKIRWKEVMDAFKEVGYQGVTSLELGYGSLTEELMPAYVDLAYRATDSLWKL